jgi:hypothetical protein
MKKLLSALIASTLLIASCSSPGGDAARPESQSSNTPEGGFDIRFLFEIDGCKLYSFKDADRRVYFANCGNTSRADLEFTESCGKNCVRTVRIETVGVNRQ